MLAVSGLIVHLIGDVLGVGAGCYRMIDQLFLTRGKDALAVNELGVGNVMKDEVKGHV